MIYNFSTFENDILNNLIYINLLPDYLAPIILFTSLIIIVIPIVLFSSKKVIFDAAGKIISTAGSLAVIGTAVNTGFGSKLINKEDKNNNSSDSNNSKDDKNNKNESKK
jgi:hypothetical protein